MRFFPRASKDLRVLKQHFPVFAIAVVYFLIRSHYFDYPIIWDSRAYYLDILTAQMQPFQFLNYSGNHNSQLWLLLAGLPNYFFRGDYHIYNAWIALLSTTAVVGFYAIIKTLFESRYSVAEALLLTCLFAFHPSVFINLIHATVDTGLLIFLIWFMIALLKDKTLWATVAGCCLLFSKEPAIVYLAVIVIFCALRQPFGMRLAWIKRQYLVFCIPYGVFGIYLIYKAIALKQVLFFGGFLQGADYSIRTWPDKTLVNYALMALVLNFNWVFSILGTAFAFGLCWVNRKHKSLFYKSQAAAFTWLLLATLLIALGVRHYSNLRYLLPVFPVLVICFAYVLPFVVKKSHRLVILSALLMALIAQNVRSIDPASNSVFCRTSFGMHKVLAIPDFDKVCKSNEKAFRLTGDRMVYNTEFLYITMLVDDVMKDIVSYSIPIFIIDSGYWYMLFGGLDDKFKITYNPPKNIVHFRLFPELLKIKNNDYIKSLPQILYYLEFPTERNRMYRRFLSAHYSQSVEKTYDIDGYTLKVIKFRNKNSGDWCEKP